MTKKPCLSSNQNRQSTAMDFKTTGTVASSLVWSHNYMRHSVCSGRWELVFLITTYVWAPRAEEALIRSRCNTSYCIITDISLCLPFRGNVTVMEKLSSKTFLHQLFLSIIIRLLKGNNNLILPYHLHILDVDKLPNTLLLTVIHFDLTNLKCINEVKYLLISW